MKILLLTLRSQPWEEVKISKPVSVASFFGTANATAKKKPAKEPAKVRSGEERKTR